MLWIRTSGVIAWQTCHSPRQLHAGSHFCGCSMVLASAYVGHVCGFKRRGLALFFQNGLRSNISFQVACLHEANPRAPLRRQLVDSPACRRQRAPLCRACQHCVLVNIAPLLGSRQQVRWKLSLQPQEERDPVLDARSKSVLKCLEYVSFFYFLIGCMNLARSRRYVSSMISTRSGGERVGRLVLSSLFRAMFCQKRF